MSTDGNLPRRDFLKGAIAGALTGLSGCGGGSEDVVSLEPRLEGDHGSWTFIGSEDWSQDSRGVLFSPVWNQRKARYGDLLKREDFAFPSKEVLTNTDLSLEFQTFYWSVTNLSIVVRAQDDRRFYCVEFDDMGRKGSKYSVRLFVQDGSGYRRDIAGGFAPHPELPERWVQRGPRPEEWEEATPGWMKARVLAEGNRIRVFMDGKQVLEALDESYGAGRAGVMARGPVKMRRLSIRGRRGRPDAPWSAAGEEHPRYFYPYPDPDKVYGDNQTYPGVCRTAEGDLLVWMSVNGDPHRFNDFLLVRSRDEGRSWGEPVLVEKLSDGGRPGFFFGHRDGRLSCLYTYGWKSEVAGPKVAFSEDGGKNLDAGSAVGGERQTALRRGQGRGNRSLLPHHPLLGWHPASVLLPRANGGGGKRGVERRTAGPLAGHSLHRRRPDLDRTLLPRPRELRQQRVHGGGMQRRQHRGLRPHLAGSLHVDEPLRGQGPHLVQADALGLHRRVPPVVAPQLGGADHGQPRRRHLHEDQCGRGPKLVSGNPRFALLGDDGTDRDEGRAGAGGLP